MDVVVQIFKSLGVNETIYLQLAFILFFLIAFYFLFIDSLRSILIARKQNTVGAEDLTSEIIKKAIANEEKYQRNVQDKLQSVNSVYNENRSQINKINDQEFKATETKLMAEFQGAMKVMESDYDSAKNKISSEISDLSGKLVDKIRSGK
ncbi:MAG: hypothetical protein QE271_01670 [Bacteriovoracaceae bacterium]|nr:hypothetical protein [Bacteriovoracaceae bacterium]